MKRKVRASKRNLEERIDYAQREYGVTEEELDQFVRRMNQRITLDRRARRMKVFTGDLEKDIAD